jgi:hypothetical protein
VYALLVAGWPLWAASVLLTPVVLCGGLVAWLASQSLLPQLAMVVAYPAALAAGVVLVDSTAPNDIQVSPQKVGSYSVVKHVSALASASASASARLGVGRLIARSDFSDLPPQSRDEARASAATAMEMGSFLDEFAVANRSESEAGRLIDLDGRPLFVLTAHRGNLEGWTASQDKLARLSTNSLHRVVPGATHASLVENPDHAAAVSEAIHEDLVAVRTAEPLANH